MHGLVHSEFRDFVIRSLGADGWAAVLKDAGVEASVYWPTETYADADLLALVLEYSRRSHQRVQEVLTAFGQSYADAILRAYGAFVQPEWGTLELVLNTERIIHRAVRRQDLNATPPRLTVTRRNADEVSVIYTSERRMCAFGKGVILGVANHFGEQVSVLDAACMHKGDPHCELLVRTVKADGLS